uniref:Uncharacterized protein n=1 Tax=Panagrolaimus davidi TaxID=227884 RepID=A0A914PMS5_9BILA
MFPVPMFPVQSVPCEKCRVPLKFMDICVKPKVGTCTSDNVIKVNCGECFVATRNGDSRPFIPNKNNFFESVILFKSVMEIYP